MTNGETILTRFVRGHLEGRGALCIKLSDKFTRGVPDMMVVTSRIIMCEFKVYASELCVTTWSDLGLSGAQDSNIRRICRRTGRGACVITGTATGDSVLVWSPICPEREVRTGKYRIAAGGLEGAMSWLDAVPRT